MYLHNRTLICCDNCDRGEVEWRGGGGFMGGVTVGGRKWERKKGQGVGFLTHRELKENTHTGIKYSHIWRVILCYLWIKSDNSSCSGFIGCPAMFQSQLKFLTFQVAFPLFFPSLLLLFFLSWLKHDRGTTLQAKTLALNRWSGCCVVVSLNSQPSCSISVVLYHNNDKENDILVPKWLYNY